MTSKMVCEPRWFAAHSWTVTFTELVSATRISFLQKNSQFLTKRNQREREKERELYSLKMGNIRYLEKVVATVNLLFKYNNRMC